MVRFVAKKMRPCHSGYASSSFFTLSNEIPGTTWKLYYFSKGNIKNGVAA